MSAAMTVPMFARPAVPARALYLSTLSLAVPLVAPLVDVPRLAELEQLMWLLALVPAFLLAYYRGWRGAATALAAGMAVLSVSHALRMALGAPAPDTSLLVQGVAGYIAVSLGIGWVTEALHRARREAELLSYRDPLTLLPNRRYARIELDRRFEAASRGEALSVIFFDIDRFKNYNDAHGHLAGDDALARFSAVLASTIGHGDIAARYGGEEFIVIMNAASTRTAEALTVDVMRALRRAQPEVGLTVSAGIAEWGAAMASADELLDAADAALYGAKAAGRNCYRRYHGRVTRLAV